MSTRTLYLVRHGAADAWGELTNEGVKQSELIGQRLARLPIDVVWHSPLSRAKESARIIAEQMPRVFVDEAVELIDHVPYVPKREELSPSWTGFFDGYDRREAEAGQAAAGALVARFGTANAPGQRSTHEVLITHAYQIAWLVCHALDTPPQHWMSLVSIANTGLTVIKRTQGEPAGVIMVNDLSHLPAELRWTGFAGGKQL